ncbi:PTS system, lactose/cellobiose family IIC component [Coprobacillus sp. D7]|nr:PTS system, lactose/cellobiose family IIC component [Coprobacillus sp. D7]
MEKTEKGLIQKIQAILEDRVVPVAMKISQQRHLASIRDGLTILVPITIIGGFAVLLAQPPVAADVMPTNFILQILCAWRDWAASCADTLLIPYNLTIGAISIYVVLGVSYRLCKHYKMDTISNIITTLLVYLCVAGIPTAFVTDEATVTAVPLTNLGASGMFTAIIVALGVIEINHFFIEKKLVIRLPDSVPPNVAAPFNVLIPGVVSLLVFMGIDGLCIAYLGTGITGLVYAVFQPLLSATGSLPSIILINLLMTTFWFFGIHGGNMLGIVTTPITTAALALNAEAYVAGKELPCIFAGAFNTVYGGYISYMAVIICILIAGKAAQSRSIAKLAIVSTAFNINEPVIFGLPTVLNPFTLIVFFICNNLNVAIAYILMSSGFLGKFYITLPFTVPGPLQAWLASMDIKAIFVWLALLVLDVVIAMPFMRAYDKQLLAEEVETIAEN